jgi:hypothetical protein
MAPLARPPKSRQARKLALAERALADLAAWQQALVESSATPAACGIPERAPAGLADAREPPGRQGRDEAVVGVEE